ncbi:MAG TPA: HAMP domain-containing protein, partial [Candidatus Pacearchaeota archaeon]|nr:HAMP domain-containing protein [Candidatus Pacearchaeota archaeon]
MFKSLKFRIFSFVFIFLAMTIVAQALLSAYFFQKQTIIRENVKVENIAKFTSDFFAESYDKNYSTDFEKFSESARHLISISPVLDAVQMTDIKGRILFDTRFLSKKSESQDVFIEKELLGYATSSKPVYLKGDEGFFTIAILPVIEELGFHRYTLFYRVNYSSLANEASAMVRQFAQITAIFFALFLAFCLFFIFALLKPMSDLEKGIKIVNQGNFDYKLKTDGGDEVANIALGFNKMAQDLKHSMLKSQKVSALEQELLTKEKDLAARLTDVKAKTEEIEQFKVALLNLSEDAGNSRDLAIKERDKTVAIINNFADALLVLGKNNEILLVNPMAEKYFKIRQQGTVGKALGG